MIGFAASPGTDVEPTCSMAQHGTSEHGTETSRLPPEHRGPCRVVVNEVDRVVVHDRTTDDHRLDRLVG